MKTITAIPDVPDFVARINELLPPEIRLWGYVRPGHLSLTSLCSRGPGPSAKLIQCSIVRLTVSA